jgi:hypothetical protein
MPIDFERVIQATVDSVLDNRASASQPAKGAEKGKKRGLSTTRAFLIGAGAITAGRLIVGSRGRDMLGNVQQRLIDYEQTHFGSGDDEEYDDEEEEFEDEEPEDFEDEQPEAEEDEDCDEEEDEPEPRPRRRRARTGSGSGRR